MMDAWRLIMRGQQDLALAELARRSAQVKTTSVIEEVPVQFDDFAGAEYTQDLTPTDHANLEALRNRGRGEGYLALNLEEQRSLYLSNPTNPPEHFDTYRAQRIAWLQQQTNTLTISNMLIKGDAITYMKENAGCFDHIITDIPYGIDMEMLNQQQPSIQNIDTVVAEHTVEGNVDLFHSFFPAAFGALKENGFCITWCDIMQWQLMYDLATKAGFKVTRWPITWNKLSPCINQTAQFNFTKSTEIAIVCR